MSLEHNFANVTQILVVIPAFNHAKTLKFVVEGVLHITPHLLVVDDGSTDLPAPEAGELPPHHPLYGVPLKLIRHTTNRGKGAAIMTAVAYAKTIGASHIITIDADAQHNPNEIPLFLEAISKQPHAIHVGARDFSTPNVPFSSRFGRSFSNFWFKVQTAHSIEDSQCGFRAYPVALFGFVKLTETKYSFEVEVIVKSVWAGFPVLNRSISVYYPPKKERVSHFKAIRDNIIISLLNTRLTIRAIMPWPHKQYLVNQQSGNISLLRPVQSLRLLLLHQETPAQLAYSAAIGMGIGTLPLPGLHSILIIIATSSLRLNKILGLAISQLCMPPIIPALCIETGHYLRYGVFLTNISWHTLGYEAIDRLVEWLIGGLFLAPILAGLLGGITWCSAKVIQVALEKNISASSLKADTNYIQPECNQHE